MWQLTLALHPLSLLRFVWLNFGLPFSGPCSQDFLVFLFMLRAKEVFYASRRICSSVQNKQEPPAHFKKRFCLFLTLQKVTMVLKTFHCRKNIFVVVVLEFDDSCYVDVKQYRFYFRDNQCGQRCNGIMQY